MALSPTAVSTIGYVTGWEGGAPGFIFQYYKAPQHTTHLPAFESW